MDKFVAVVFDNEAKAYEGRQALLDLHRDGDVVVYASAVIAKDADGAVSVKDVDDEGPIGTGFGMLVGGLVGALAGPAGLLVGTAAGGAFGAVRDLVVGGIDADMLDEVRVRMKPGTAVVVGDVTEGWVTPLDVRMKEVGGVVHRKATHDVVDEQIDADMRAVEAEFKELRAEYREAAEEAKANLKAKIDKGRAKLEASVDQAEKRLEELKRDADARVEALQTQIKTAKAEKKAMFEKRLEEIKADYARRSEKLKQAAALAKEALAA